MASEHVTTTTSSEHHLHCLYRHWWWRPHMLCLDWTSYTMQIHRTASFLFFSLPLITKPMYDTDLFRSLCTIQSRGRFMYDINLRATTTMILSIRGVTIPIDLVSSATDSIKWSVVLFKPVTILTSDPKSEFLWQSSLIAQNLQTPWTTSYALDISHALVITYHPYAHEPSALTEYLKQKLRSQRAKHLSRSHSAPVKPNIPLGHNTICIFDPLKIICYQLQESVTTFCICRNIMCAH